MIEAKLNEIAGVLGETFEGDDLTFKGISIDTRTLKGGELFVAIRGPHFDGHKFIEEARTKGAVCAIVSKDFEGNVEIPIIKVEDTIFALGEVAKFWRSKFNVPVVGITGSNGKSTTKEMVASILSSKGEVLKTKGNFNNLIGLPLTIFKWGKEHKSAVLEMGMNAPGEIKRLTQIANPQVGVITTVTAAHLEKLHSVEAVANAKGELLETMNQEGTAVLNDEDPWVRKLAKQFSGRVITFGMQNESTIRFLHMEREGWDETDLKIMVNEKEFDLRLPIPGVHNVMNAMAAIGVAYALQIDMSVSIEKLKTFEPMSMRMERVQLANGVCLINDSYNANPGSWEAALRTVSAIKRAGKLYAVLGEMLELGSDTKKLHKQAGSVAASESANSLLVWGEHALDVVNGAKEKGLSDARVYENREDLARTLSNEVKAGDVILVKGSRGSKMDEVADYLKSTFGSG